MFDGMTMGAGVIRLVHRYLTVFAVSVVSSPGSMGMKLVITIGGLEVVVLIGGVQTDVRRSAKENHGHQKRRQCLCTFDFQRLPRGPCRAAYRETMPTEAAAVNRGLILSLILNIREAARRP